MDTGWHLCFARNWEELWMTGPWLQRCKKVKCSVNSAVSSHQTEDRQCLCVYVHVCMHFSHPGLQTHDGRNLAKHPVCKIMEDFTPINKHTFQKIIYHKFQSIYIPVSFQNLGNPQFMSICFFSEQTFACIILYRSAEIKKASGCFPQARQALDRHSKQPRMLSWSEMDLSDVPTSLSIYLSYEVVICCLYVCSLEGKQ